MASLQDNLAAAREAVKYVQGKMTVGAQNKFSDVFSSLGRSLLCVPAIRSVEIALPRDKSTALPDYLRGAALIAEDVGCGNCGEQAAIAFYHLEKTGAKPLDYMALLPPGDHAFVVIGRVDGSAAGDYRTWGDAAVVCDPWDEKAFAAREVPSKLYKGGEPGIYSLYRSPRAQGKP